MATPYVKTNELDGQLGNQKQTSGLPMAIVAPAISGSLNPQVFQTSKEVIAEYTAGAGVEAAAYALDVFGASSVVFVRAASGNAEAYSAVDETLITGSCTPTADTNVTPNDSFRCRVQIVTGGTIGSAGIKYRTSLDDGLTYGATFPLGTATSITFPNTGGVSVSLGAGTFNALDEFSFTVDAAYPTNGELSTALDSLAATSKSWEFAAIVGMDLDTTSGQTVATWLQGLHSSNKHKWAIGSFRAKGAAESDNDYLDAFQLFRDSVSSTSLVVTVDRCDMLSSYLSGRLQRAPSLAIAGLCSAISEEVDPASIDSKFSGDAGPLPGVSVRDANGNPIYVDATVNGSALDDINATVLRTWDGYNGVFCNNVRLLSSPDSDFQFLPSRRVMNLARAILNAYMIRQLSKPLPRNPKTGFVLESALVRLEEGANAVLSSALLVKPKASFVRFTASRSDSVVQAPYKLTGKLALGSLAYPKAIEVDVFWTVTL